MTVADLIRELQAMPNQAAPVRLFQGTVWTGHDAIGWEPHPQCAADSMPVVCVRHEGAFVTVESD